jgi:hypothetical protein
MTLENKIQTIEREAEEKLESLSLRDKIKCEAINWAIDTSAKTGGWKLLMGLALNKFYIPE